MFDNKIVLTGVKPTGTPHLGNYVGAIKPMLEMVKGNKSIVFIADLHALNMLTDPQLVAKYSYDVAATFLALGLNPEETIFFRQSDVPEVTQMTLLLSNVTAKGLMNRAHSYKAKVEQNKEKGEDVDSGVNMGLYIYPVLMAADILLYGSDIVPVGKDQKQHVEFARDIAGSLNYTYGKNLLKIPEPYIQEETGLVPGLDGRKMSKSYDNYIPIFAPENQLKKLVMRIITDCKLPEEPKDPDESSIFALYKHFASPQEIESMRQSFLKGGMGYGTAKQLLFEAINTSLKDARAKYEALINNPAQIDEILLRGAQTARKIAQPILNKVAKAMLGKTIVPDTDILAKKS